MKKTAKENKRITLCSQRTTLKLPSVPNCGAFGTWRLVKNTNTLLIIFGEQTSDSLAVPRIHNSLALPECVQATFCSQIMNFSIRELHSCTNGTPCHCNVTRRFEASLKRSRTSVLHLKQAQALVTFQTVSVPKCPRHKVRKSSLRSVCPKGKRDAWVPGRDANLLQHKSGAKFPEEHHSTQIVHRVPERHFVHPTSPPSDDA